MKKRILWIPQLATVDKVTGKTIIDADSNIVILKCIINSLKNDFDFHILMPQEVDCNVTFIEVFGNNTNIKIEMLSSKNESAFSLRYDFDYLTYKTIIKEVGPDIIVNNTAPISRNIKAILKSLKLPTQLVSFMHFLDLPKENKVPRDISYFMRQADGLFISDLCVFQSETVKEKTLKGLKTYFKKYMEDENIKLNYTVWNGTYSQTELNNYQLPMPRWDIPYKVNIMFPNRLSSTNYSNHLRFFAAIRNISKQRNDFNVFVNNPTKYMTFEEMQNLCPNLSEVSRKQLSRDEYISLLHLMDIGVALFTQEGHGGVSSKEFQAAGCLPIFPRINEYKYLMPRGYEGFVKKDLNNLEDALNKIIDIIKYKQKFKHQMEGLRRIYERDSIECNVKKIKKSLDEL